MRIFATNTKHKQIMASRRILKKAIKSISNELLTDCMAISMVGDADETKLKELVARTLRMEQEYVARVNHTEPGSVRLFYTKLRNELAQEANDIAAEIVTL